MKIYVFDTADFEIQTLEKLNKSTDSEIVIRRDSLTMDTVSEIYDGDAVSVLGYSRINRELLLELKALGINHISTRTIGFDHIDVASASELGMHVYNAYYQPSNVADFTVMMMLIMLRKAKISVCRALVNDFSLDGMQGRELRSMTVGIIGTGKIGATVIKDLSGFGCKIYAYSHHEREDLSGLCQYVDLETIYRECDIISLHIPLTDDNYHMIDRDALYRMKKGVILINTARGQLIDTEDLIAALEDEQVGGAGIDTLEEEAGIMHVDVGTRIVDNRSLLYLKQFPNVLYTQHYAFFTEEATTSMTTCGVTSLEEGFAGDNLINEVTK